MSLVNYKGYIIEDAATGDAGIALTDDIKKSADDIETNTDDISSLETTKADAADLVMHESDGSAHGATPLNTPETIVQRDSNGDFSAGTITADLDGTASNATTAVNLSGTITESQVTGLGDMATQNSTSVSITGGTITGTNLNSNASIQVFSHLNFGGF